MRRMSLTDVGAVVAVGGLAVMAITNLVHGITGRPAQTGDVQPYERPWRLRR